MTKLMEWLYVLIGFFSIWSTFVGGYYEHPLVEKYRTLIILSPAIGVILFGLYAAIVVLYRVFTFNNCEEAAKELQEEILQAKAELKEKGLSW